MARGIADEVAQGPRLWDALDARAGPSEIDRLLGQAPLATVIAAHALGAPRILQWWTSWRGVHLAVRGADLIAAGIAPGPAMDVRSAHCVRRCWTARSTAPTSNARLRSLRPAPAK